MRSKKGGLFKPPPPPGYPPTTVLQSLDVSTNSFKGHVCTEWLAFMEKAVSEQVKEQAEEAELNDDPFASSDEEDVDDEN